VAYVRIPVTRLLVLRVKVKNMLYLRIYLKKICVAYFIFFITN